MGKVKDGFIVGPVGKLTYREYNGQQIVQSRAGAGNTNMSARSMLQADFMGKSSSLAKHIRENLQKSVNGWYDGKMVNRLTKEVRTIVNQCYEDSELRFERFSFCGLSGLDFNSFSPMRESAGFSPVVTQADGLLKVTIPELTFPDQLKFPKGATLCELTISVTLIRLSDSYIMQYPFSQSVVAEKSLQLLPAQEFIFEVPDGCLCIASMALKYTCVKNNIMTLFNHQTFNPVAVIDAYITDGTYAGTDTNNWSFMPKVNFYNNLTAN